jgi:hypothetical protein
VGPRTGLDDKKKKFLTLPGLELQPVASRYTYYATGAPCILHDGPPIHYRRYEIDSQLI